MVKSFMYGSCIFIQMLIRRRVLEDISGLEKGISQIKKRSRWCMFCIKCRLIWYMTSAIKMEDPYKIVEINNLLIAMGVNYELSLDAGGYVKESMAWIGQDVPEVDSSDEVSAADLIRKWKLHQLTPSDSAAINATTAHLRWPLEIVRGSISEMLGNNEDAVQDYRRALKIMPQWLSEAKTVYQKVNELGHA